MRPDGDLELGRELALLTLACLLSLWMPGTACAGVRMAAAGDRGAEATCSGPLPTAAAPDGNRGPGSRPSEACWKSALDPPRHRNAWQAAAGGGEGEAGGPGLQLRNILCELHVSASWVLPQFGTLNYPELGRRVLEAVQDLGGARAADAGTHSARSSRWPPLLS